LVGGILVLVTIFIYPGKFKLLKPGIAPKVIDDGLEQRAYCQLLELNSGIKKGLPK
jgi:hypothetical protein